MPLNNAQELQLRVAELETRQDELYRNLAHAQARGSPCDHITLGPRYLPCPHPDCLSRPAGTDRVRYAFMRPSTSIRYALSPRVEAEEWETHTVMHLESVTGPHVTLWAWRRVGTTREPTVPTAPTARSPRTADPQIQYLPRSQEPSSADEQMFRRRMRYGEWLSQNPPVGTRPIEGGPLSVPQASSSTPNSAPPESSAPNSSSSTPPHADRPTSQPDESSTRPSTPADPTSSSS